MSEQIVTIKIDQRLGVLLDAATRELDVTHGTNLRGEDLVLALLERGARAVIGHAADRDQRKVSELTVADLADVFGVIDLETARRNSRTQREHTEKACELVKGALKNVENLCEMAQQTIQQFSTLQQFEAFAANVRRTFTEAPGHGIVMIAGTVHVDDAGGHHVQSVAPPVN